MSGLRNAARGETLLMVSGAPKRLCLTLGALAELEAAFDAASIDELAHRIACLSADDLITVVAALSGMQRGDVAAADISPREAAAAVADAFRLAFSDD